jgi:polyisoprenoid-binding protein YceI
MKLMARSSLGLLSLVVMIASGCSKDKASATNRSEPAAAASATAGQKRLAVSAGTMNFLIDAPLEKIKGRSIKLRGSLDIDPQNLKASRGQIEFDLDDLKTETFDDADKNKSQTEHTKNWLEIGPDVEAKRREENRWARFTIKSIEETSAPKPTIGTPMTVKATGDLWLHGVTSPKTVVATVTFSGTPESPTLVRVVTAQPLRISLKEHDVKPRDLAGKFLAGALEKIGQKIDDSVEISLDLTAM